MTILVLWLVGVLFTSAALRQKGYLVYDRMTFWRWARLVVTWPYLLGELWARK